MCQTLHRLNPVHPVNPVQFSSVTLSSAARFHYAAPNRMFHDIPLQILERMAELERRDALDRTDATPRPQRLRQIPPEVGKFIALLAAAAPPGRCLEIGTSAGYSTLWLVLACRAVGRKITTFEILQDKAALARQTFAQAGVTALVELVTGDALQHLPGCHNIAFCFLDAEKESYQAAYDLVVPRLVPGGMLVADNAINHRATLEPMLDHALGDRRVDALIVPIGKGQLLCRKKSWTA
ncbi:MAG TPA: class I SAM-dependent methyltransferase [Verrucomicrobiae bacterium]|nr:class I SAM-dependent methyltransferase [Verrucomicrobiae bacterium]